MDGQITPVHLIQPLYKHLMGWPVTFKDLEHIDDQVRTPACMYSSSVCIVQTVWSCVIRTIGKSHARCVHIYFELLSDAVASEPYTAHLTLFVTLGVPQPV
jgi:hypothetical protein